jgi:hypothetical protein
LFGRPGHRSTFKLVKNVSFKYENIYCLKFYINNIHIGHDKLLCCIYISLYGHFAKKISLWLVSSSPPYARILDPPLAEKDVSLGHLQRDGPFCYLKRSVSVYMGRATDNKTRAAGGV